MSCRLPLAVYFLLIPAAVAAPSVSIVEGKIVVSGIAEPKGLSVVVAEGTEADIATRPAMAGEWAAGTDRVTFTPRYPLTPGVKYRVQGTTRPLEVRLPKPIQEKPTVVTRVRPSAREIPDNILRFYVEFNRSMPRGDVYRYIQVLKADGRPVPQPFLELDDELWNPDQTRLTLVIDPGRVKRGVKPQIDLGPVFQEGHKYTLVISGKWPTLDGKPLGEDYKVSIAATAPIRQGIDPATWKLTVPEKPTAPLRVAFGRTLDHALLLRSLTVLGSDDQPVAGQAESSEEDRAWTFRPKAGWTAGEYKVRVDTRLEDVCANRIGVPFEVDATRPIPPEVKVPYLDLPFTISR